MVDPQSHHKEAGTEGSDDGGGEKSLTSSASATPSSSPLLTRPQQASGGSHDARFDGFDSSPVPTRPPTDASPGKTAIPPTASRTPPTTTSESSTAPPAASCSPSTSNESKLRPLDRYRLRSAHSGTSLSRRPSSLVEHSRLRWGCHSKPANPSHPWNALPDAHAAPLILSLKQRPRGPRPVPFDRCSASRARPHMWADVAQAISASAGLLNCFLTAACTLQTSGVCARPVLACTREPSSWPPPVNTRFTQ